MAQYCMQERIFPNVFLSLRRAGQISLYVDKDVTCLNLRSKNGAWHGPLCTEEGTGARPPHPAFSLLTFSASPRHKN